MFSGKNIYVSGGRTGFLGANLARELLRRGAVVYAQSLQSKKPTLLEDSPPNLREIICNLSESAAIPEGTDYVFHCAAHTSGAHEMATNPVAQINENAFINSHILDAAAKAKVKKFVFISSSAVYPELNRSLKEEDAFLGDPPETYFGPAWMKRYSEKLAEFYYRRHGMEALIIRPSNAYGPYSSFDRIASHVLPALIRKFMEKQDPLEVWGTPDVVRDFIYIDDLVRGILLAFQNSSGFEVFNIASGSLKTIGEAVENISELTGYRGRYSFNSAKPMTVRQRKIDTTKARETLGFHPEIPFKEGLKRTIDWYREQVSPTGKI